MNPSGRTDPVAEKLPKHIAFIMDGNGRWARRRGLPRIKGHERGAETLRIMMETLIQWGVPEATFYALSSENFKNRPEKEIKRLIQLMESHLVKQKDLLMREKIRFVVIGRTGQFPESTQALIQDSVDATAAHTRFTFRVALNYGGRQEILDAARAMAQAASTGALTNGQLADFAERDFRRYLYDPGMTDPELLIRTGGHNRLSNFLLWQCSYTEVYVTKTLWPAFREKHLQAAVKAYARETRKFGSVCE